MAPEKAVLIHDTIPLDHPDTQRKGAVAEFEQKLSLVSRCADVVICTSAQCQADVTRHMIAMGPVPKIVMAHLGVEIPVLDTDFTMPQGPYFVTVGTIEARKNHALLLDIWDDWGADAPPLFICGKRGWRNDAIFTRLDAGVNGVVEENNLTDGQIATLLSGATAMLFPSCAEGFGLPPAEALALECRVVCADLAVYGEVLGESAVYVSLSDRYLWQKTIKKLAASDRSDFQRKFVAPTWADHFKIVLTMV
ncbi:glycosyltransferase [Yoonia sp. MH D7]